MTRRNSKRRTSKRPGLRRNMFFFPPSDPPSDPKAHVLQLLGDAIQDAENILMHIERAEHMDTGNSILYAFQRATRAQQDAKAVQLENHVERDDDVANAEIAFEKAGERAWAALAKVIDRGMKAR